MEIVAKIYLNDEGLLTFEALSGDVIENRLYPSGGDRIGVVVIDTENNLEIAENAIEPLKNLFKNSVTDSGDMGDIDMFKSDDEKYCLSWIGPNKRIFKVSEKVYRAGGAFVYDNKFKIKK
jgi:hypothetical protein